MTSMNVDVILPCLDEAEALPRVLSRLPSGYRAIVVDNGSTDGSADVARAHGATVVTEPRKGFGSACAAGVAAATADIVAFCDADASMDPLELTTLVDRVASGRIDLALGRRRPTGSGAWAPHAHFANVVLAFLMRRATGYRLHDLGPMRAMHREALVALDLQDRRSGYPLEMVLAAHRAGWTVDESDIGYAQRIGDSKVTGTLRGTVNAIKDMSRLLAQYRKEAHVSGSGLGPRRRFRGGAPATVRPCRWGEGRGRVVAPGPVADAGGVPTAAAPPVRPADPSPDVTSTDVTSTDATRAAGVRS